jgi:hypothetical protein
MAWSILMEAKGINGCSLLSGPAGNVLMVMSSISTPQLFAWKEACNHFHVGIPLSDNWVPGLGLVHLAMD